MIKGGKMKKSFYKKIVWNGRVYEGLIIWDDELFPNVKLFVNQKYVGAIRINSDLLKGSKKIVKLEY
jgi:hypothetical protein